MDRETHFDRDSSKYALAPVQLLQYVVCVFPLKYSKCCDLRNRSAVLSLVLFFCRQRNKVSTFEWTMWVAILCV